MDDDSGTLTLTLRLDRLEKEMAINDEMVTKLTQQLQPILGPELSAETDGSGGGMKDTGEHRESEVMERIAHLESRMRQRNRAIISLMDRAHI